ncbi:MAG: hypothetical protein J6T72_04210 [Alphaproteobacteria bacterium]|nr:hypothetical protein [Alphaproteobacteria bacterium]
MGNSFDSVMELSNEEKVAYMMAFARLAGADGVFSDVEKEFIEDMAKSYFLPEKSLQRILSATDSDVISAVKNIKRRRVALDLIKNLCFLGYSDEELSDEELLFIGKVGEAMGVAPEKIEEISEWVVEKIILAERAKIVFEEVQ